MDSLLKLLIARKHLAVGLIFTVGGAPSPRGEPDYNADVLDGVKTPDSVSTTLLGDFEPVD